MAKKQGWPWDWHQGRIERLRNATAAPVHSGRTAELWNFVFCVQASLSSGSKFVDNCAGSWAATHTESGAGRCWTPGPPPGCCRCRCSSPPGAASLPTPHHHHYHQHTCNYKHWTLFGHRYCDDCWIHNVLLRTQLKLVLESWTSCLLKLLVCKM